MRQPGGPCQVYVLGTRKGCILGRDCTRIQTSILLRFPLRLVNFGDSIKIFGFNVPVLVNADLNVIAGHGRLLAARELGITEVPTLCLDHLTPAQARAFMIADNRLTEIATWDDRLLAEQLKDLSLLGLDFSSRPPASRSARSICGSPLSM